MDRRARSPQQVRRRVAEHMNIPSAYPKVCEYFVASLGIPSFYVPFVVRTIQGDWPALCVEPTQTVSFTDTTLCALLHSA